MAPCFKYYNNILLRSHTFDSKQDVSDFFFNAKYAIILFSPLEEQIYLFKIFGASLNGEVEINKGKIKGFQRSLFCEVLPKANNKYRPEH